MNGVFAVVMEEAGGLVIFRIDLVTGDYKITRREELLSQQGVVIKSVTVLADSEILVLMEPENLRVRETLVQ